MKRLKMLFVLFLSFSLTGCIQDYTITIEKSDAAAEYMAGLLLKYDEDYEQGLLSEKDLSVKNIDEDETVTEGNDDTTVASSDSVSQSDASNSDNDTIQDYTLTEVIGHQDFNFKYGGYELTETYPEDPDSAGFSLTPRDGYQLLVTSFTVKNLSDSKKELNLIDTDIAYQLDINVGTVYKPLLTLLENDLQYIDITIEGGKSEKVLLVFEISKDIDMSNVNLIVSKESKSVIIEMKNK